MGGFPRTCSSETRVGHSPKDTQAVRGSAREDTRGSIHSGSPASASLGERERVSAQRGENTCQSLNSTSKALPFARTTASQPKMWKRSEWSAVKVSWGCITGSAAAWCCVGRRCSRLGWSLGGLIELLGSCWLELVLCQGRATHHDSVAEHDGGGSESHLVYCTRYEKRLQAAMGCAHCQYHAQRITAWVPQHHTARHGTTLQPATHATAATAAAVLTICTWMAAIQA